MKCKISYMILIFAIIACALTMSPAMNGTFWLSTAYAAKKEEVQVKGHSTKKGTYVKPHKRVIEKKNAREKADKS